MTTNVVDSTGKIIALEILSSAIGCQKKDDGGVIMRVIVCVDDNGGMLFNHRRQSRDRVLCERVLQMADERDCSVYMNTYSAKIFRKITELQCLRIIWRKQAYRICVLSRKSRWRLILTK